MAIKKTHSVMAVRAGGRKRVLVHATATTWVVGFEVQPYENVR